MNKAFWAKTFRDKYLAVAIALALSITATFSFAQNVKYSPLGGFMPNGNNYVVDSIAYIRGLKDSVQRSLDQVTSAGDSTANRIVAGKLRVVSPNVTGGSAIDTLQYTSKTYNTTANPYLRYDNITNLTGNYVWMDYSIVNGVVRYSRNSFGNVFFTNDVFGVGFNGKVIKSSGGLSGSASSFLSNITFTDSLNFPNLGYSNTDNFYPKINTNSLYSAFDFSGEIKQLGTSNGKTWGVYLHPNLSAAYDYRAIQMTNSVGKGIYQTGTAPNYLSGNVGINVDTTASISAALQVKPKSTAAGGGGLKIDLGKVTTPENGLLEQDPTTSDLLWTIGTTRSAISRQGIDVVTNVASMIAYTSLPKLIYVTDSLQGGWFYYSTASLTADNMTIFTATGKGTGFWVRIFDRAKGINVDWAGTRDDAAIRSAVSVAGQNGIINFAPNRTYIQKQRIIPLVNQTFQGNKATLKRNDDSLVTLTAVALATDSSITVNAVPSFWSVNNYVHLFTDTTAYSGSNSLSIKSIIGNVVKFTRPIGGIFITNASHPQITQWEIGTKAHYAYNQIEDNGGVVNFSIYNLTFDGNKDNNGANHAWYYNVGILLHGIEGQATIDHCNFYNMPNECIMGHGFKITNNYAYNLNGSFIHLSAVLNRNPLSIPSIIQNNITDLTNQIPDSISDHNEGVITFSNTSGYTNIDNNRFSNGKDNVYGAIQSGNDATSGGVRDLNITNTYAKNFNGLFYGTPANPTGLLYKYGHILIDNFHCTDCGTTDWTTSQAGINASDSIMVTNFFPDGNTVWKIPVLNSDSLQRYVLNNATSTPQKARINISGGLTVTGSTTIASANLTGTTLINGVDSVASMSYVRSIGGATGGASQWTTTGSDIYYGTGKVGITTTSPLAKVHILTTGIGITQSDANGILLENTTAAISSVQQWSPPLVFSGKGWASTPAASQDVRWKIDAQSTSGTSGPGSVLTFGLSTNGGSYGNLYQFSNNGNLTVNGSIIPSTGGIILPYTTTATGTTGARTINTAGGDVNFAAGATSLVVTNSRVTANSNVFTTIKTVDANKPRVVAVVPSAGSFTITLDTAPAAEIKVGFNVF